MAHLVAWVLLFQVLIVFAGCLHHANGAHGAKIKQDSSLYTQHAPLAYKQPFYGNELEVYEHYNNMTSALNDKSMFNLWQDCVNKVSQNFRNGGCVATAHSATKERMSSAYTAAGELHDPRIRSVYADGSADCTYKLHLHTTATATDWLAATPGSGSPRGESESEARAGAGAGTKAAPVIGNTTITTTSQHWYSFQIVTMGCKSDFLDKTPPAAPLPSGGASFDIHSWSETHASACVVHDLLSGVYHVRCPLHELGRSVSYKLAVILDFEHFDAYNDVFAAASLMDVTVFAGDVRVLHVPARDKEGMRIGSRQLRSTKPKHTHVQAQSQSHVQTKRLRRLAKETPAPQPVPRWALEKLSRMASRVHGSWERHSHGEDASRAKATSKSIPSAGASSSNSSNRMHFGAMADYHWHGSGSQFTPDSKEDFERLYGKDADEQFAQLHTTMLGESHMRYVWDLLFYLYSGGVDGLGHLERKHGASDHISRLNQYNYYFVTDLADVLLRQNCPAVGSTEIYVLQFGSWDLTYSTLRATMQNNANLPHFLAAVQQLINKCGGMNAHESTDRGRIHLIWVSPSPETRCLAKRGQQACEDKRHANNNYAISAITQRVHASMLASVATQLKSAPTADQAAGQDEELRQEEEEAEAGRNAHYSTLQDLHVTFEYVDAKWIAQPRIRLLEGVCMSHLLCHPGGDTMLLTAAGLAVAGEILASLARKAHEHAFHYHNALDHTHNNAHKHEPTTSAGGTRPESNKHGNYSIYGDAVLVIDNSSSVAVRHSAAGAGGGATATAQVEMREYFYRSSNGLRRRIPDKETLACLLRMSPLLSVKTVTAETIEDIPLVAAPLPSRRPGLVYTSDNMKGDGQEWVTTSACTRRRHVTDDANADVATSKNVLIAFEMDIYDIPQE